MAERACPVCVEPYTAQQRREVVCPKCEHGCCRRCVERYLLTTMDAPHCMQCRVAWDGAFVAANTSRVFYNTRLREHHAELLLDREKGFLPETVPYVERHRQRQALWKQHRQIEDQVQALLSQIGELRRQGAALRGQIRDLRGGPQATAEAKAFVRACPMEACRGFLSTAWKCGICEIYICPQCHNPKAGRDDPNHQCDPAAVQTAQLLARETKPCPSCGVAIFKIDGCDQMWCTQCHTPFSWRTGQVIRHGIVHNPHFFEWQRQAQGGGGGAIPRHPLDQPCGGRINAYQLRTCIRTTVARQRFLFSVVQVLNHIEDYHLRRGAPPADPPARHRDLRIRFLLQHITEDEWKRQLKRLTKHDEKNTALEQVLRMFVEVGNDLLRRCIQREVTDEDTERELEALRRYTTGELQRIGKQFHNKVPLVYIHRPTQQWVWRGVGAAVYAGLALA